MVWKEDYRNSNYIKNDILSINFPHNCKQLCKDILQYWFWWYFEKWIVGIYCVKCSIAASEPQYLLCPCWGWVLRLTSECSYAALWCEPFLVLRLTFCQLQTISAPIRSPVTTSDTRDKLQNVRSGRCKIRNSAHQCTATRAWNEGNPREREDFTFTEKAPTRTQFHVNVPFSKVS